MFCYTHDLNNNLIVYIRGAVLEIIEVNLDVVISKDSVGFVTMHTAPLKCLCDEEPFQWKVEYKPAQLAKIKRTLSIARNSDHGSRNTHFTIFPEYSVPGLDGVNVIETEINSTQWPNNSIIIAGLDNLDKAQYSELCRMENLQVVDGSAPGDLPSEKWVNCVVTWAKDNAGRVQKFVQTKIDPAWPERTNSYQHMFHGSGVFLFNCKYDDASSFPCRFLSLICYDFIGKNQRSEFIWKSSFGKLSTMFSGRTCDLSWIFVIQENSKPNSQQFLSVARDIFEQRQDYANINRDNCALVFINNSQKDELGAFDTHGFSSLIFSKNIAAFRVENAPLSFSSAPEYLRQSDLLKSSCIDVIFRERGACIHSFSVLPPKFVPASSTMKKLPILTANVHSTIEGGTDPRAIGKPVASVVKWINDKSSSIRNFGDRVPNCDLSVSAKQPFDQTLNAMKLQQGKVLSKKMKYGFVGLPDKESDRWKEPEIDVLKTILDSISIFSMATRVNVDTSESHALVELNGLYYNLVVAKGDTHGDCMKHIDSQFPATAREAIAVISRDEANSQMTEKDRDYTKPTKPRNQDGDLDYTSSLKSTIYIDFQSLLTAFKSAPDAATLRNSINDLFERH